MTEEESTPAAGVRPSLGVLDVVAMTVGVVGGAGIVLHAFLIGDYLSEVARLGLFSSSGYAALVVVGITAVNLVGVRQGRAAQAVLTALTLLGLAVIAVADAIPAVQAVALLAVLGGSLAALPLTGSAASEPLPSPGVPLRRLRNPPSNRPGRRMSSYVPTPQGVVVEMLKVAEVKPGNVVYDLGCGDGRIVITAAKDFSARGIGVDIDPRRIEESNANAKKAGWKIRSGSSSRTCSRWTSETPTWWRSTC